MREGGATRGARRAGCKSRSAPRRSPPPPAARATGGGLPVHTHRRASGSVMPERGSTQPEQPVGVVVPEDVHLLQRWRAGPGHQVAEVDGSLRRAGVVDHGRRQRLDGSIGVAQAHVRQPAQELVSAGRGSATASARWSRPGDSISGAGSPIARRTSVRRHRGVVRPGRDAEERQRPHQSLVPGGAVTNGRGATSRRKVPAGCHERELGAVGGVLGVDDADPDTGRGPAWAIARSTAGCAGRVRRRGSAARCHRRGAARRPARATPDRPPLDAGLPRPAGARRARRSRRRRGRPAAGPPRARSRRSWCSTG